MRELTYTSALAEALHAALHGDERVVALECCHNDCPASSTWYNLMQELGTQRVKSSTGRENSMIGLAIGSAIAGLRPILKLQTPTQLISALNFFVTTVGKLPAFSNNELDAPIIVFVPSGPGLPFGTQHDLTVEASLTAADNLVVLAPASGYEIKGLLLNALNEEHPVAFLESPTLYNTTSDVPEDNYTLPLEESQILRTGQSLTILAWGHNTIRALKIAEELAASSLDCEVIHLRSLKPLKLEPIIESISRTHQAVIIDDDYTSSSFGHSLTYFLQQKLFMQLKHHILRLSYWNDTPHYIINEKNYDFNFTQRCISEIRGNFGQEL